MKWLNLLNILSFGVAVFATNVDPLDQHRQDVSNKYDAAVVSMDRLINQASQLKVQTSTKNLADTISDKWRGASYNVAKLLLAFKIFYNKNVKSAGSSPYETMIKSNKDEAIKSVEDVLKELAIHVYPSLSETLKLAQADVDLLLDALKNWMNQVQTLVEHQKVIAESQNAIQRAQQITSKDQNTSPLANVSQTISNTPKTRGNQGKSAEAKKATSNVPLSQNNLPAQQLASSVPAVKNVQNAQTAPVEAKAHQPQASKDSPVHIEPILIAKVETSSPGIPQVQASQPQVSIALASAVGEVKETHIKQENVDKRLAEVKEKEVTVKKAIQDNLKKNDQLRQATGEIPEVARLNKAMEEILKAIQLFTKNFSPNANTQEYEKLKQQMQNLEAAARVMQQEKEKLEKENPSAHASQHYSQEVAKEIAKTEVKIAQLENVDSKLKEQEQKLKEEKNKIAPANMTDAIETIKSVKENINNLMSAAVNNDQEEVLTNTSDHLEKAFCNLNACGGSDQKLPDNKPNNGSAVKDSVSKAQQGHVAENQRPAIPTIPQLSNSLQSGAQSGKQDLDLTEYVKASVTKLLLEEGYKEKHIKLEEKQKRVYELMLDTLKKKENTPAVSHAINAVEAALKLLPGMVA